MNKEISGFGKESIMIFGKKIALSNGVEMPVLGLGTWFIPDEQAAKAVQEASHMGYRLIDTAQAYGNEIGVGEGIRPVELKGKKCLSAVKLLRSINPMRQLSSLLMKR